MKRIKRTTENLPALATLADVEATLSIIANSQAQADALRADIEQQIASLRQLHEDDLAAHAQTIADATSQIQRWAEQNPDAFGKRKSISLPPGRFGFRTGTPKLKTLAKWTWAKVLDAATAAGLTDYIRTKREIDREGIINDRDDLRAEDLAQIGVTIIQDETFFVEPSTTYQPA